MKKITTSSLLLILGLITGALNAQILRVPAEYTTIQAAVDAAGYGDTVLVAPGTYQENILIQGNAKVLTLASNFIFSADSNDINNTIIDASQPTNVNYGMGVLIKSQDTTIMTKITGFTITGGTGYYKTYGGGIYSSNAIPLIEYNHIHNCSITGTQPNGAGIYVGSYWNPSKVCIISHNVIKNCTITTTPTSVECNGAGMSLSNIRVIVENNIISDNVTIGSSNTNAFGGGIYYYSNMPIELFPFVSIINNEIMNNTVESWHALGGGICLLCDNGITRDSVVGNLISFNEVISIGSGGYALGGGIEIENQQAGSVISANIISDNKAINGTADSDRSGGGIYIWRSSSLPNLENLLVEKNRITGNEANDGAGITVQNTGIKLLNNFISGNQAGMRGGAVLFYIPNNINLVAEVTNNTVVNNLVTGQGGVAGSFDFYGSFNAMLLNNIFYGNQAETDDEMRIIGSQVQIDNCDLNTDEITGTWNGENNFYSDPEFIDEMNWDCYNLEAPCSETGTDEIFAFNQYFNAPSDDFQGNPRPQGEFVDVGAVEISMCYVGLAEVVSRQSSVVSYPNPAREKITIEMSGAGSDLDGTLSIYNKAGQEMITRKVNGVRVEVNVSSLPNGLYFIRLINSGKVETLRFVKE